VQGNVEAAGLRKKPSHAALFQNIAARKKTAATKRRMWKNGVPRIRSVTLTRLPGKFEMISGAPRRFFFTSEFRMSRSDSGAQAKCLRILFHTATYALWIKIKMDKNAAE
jgi:hypothetical protein